MSTSKSYCLRGETNRMCRIDASAPLVNTCRRQPKGSPCLIFLVTSFLVLCLRLWVRQVFILVRRFIWIFFSTEKEMLRSRYRRRYSCTKVLYRVDLGAKHARGSDRVHVNPRFTPFSCGRITGE